MKEIIELIDNTNAPNLYSFAEMDYVKVYRQAKNGWIVKKVYTGEGDMLLYLNRPNVNHLEVFKPVITSDKEYTVYANCLTYIIK